MTVMRPPGQATDIKPSLPLPDAPAVRLPLAASGSLAANVRARGEKNGNPAAHRLIQMHAHTHTRSHLR